MMKSVHVVFKTHLDIGFTDLAQTVVDKYMQSYIPKAIELADKLEKEQGRARFVWTTGSWLIYEYLRLSEGEKRRTMEQAIEKGHVTWHGLPFTTHTELLDEHLFDYGLSIKDQLDARFGKQTIAAKMSDVPGHTIAMVPHLAKHGIRFLHIGVNYASKIPNVPPLFVWRAKDGSEVIVNYNSSYGKVLENESIGEALIFAHTGDNMGPPSAEDVKNLFADLGEKYPDADIKASTLDAFAEKVSALKDQLPIVEEEIGDSWIHGAGADPWKVMRYRELIRLRNKWLKEGRFDSKDEEFALFSTNLLLVAEHTWGKDLKRYLPDYSHYTKEAFTAAREVNTVEEAVPIKYKYLENQGKTPASYSLFEASWQEQRDYLKKAMEPLDKQKQREAARAFAELESKIPNYGATTSLQIGKMYKLGGQFEASFASDGSLSHLRDGTGNDWSDEDYRLGVFQYQAFGVEDYHTWFQHYVCNQYTTNVWAAADFGKPGMELCKPSLPPGQKYAPLLVSLDKHEEETQDIVVATLEMPHDAVTRFGVPKQLSIRYTFSTNHQGRIGVDLVWEGKTACRLPEASWFSFSPKVYNPNLWTMDKMGQDISPLEVVRNGGRNLHAVLTGVRYAGTEGSIKIESLDAPLLAPGKQRLLRFDNTFVSLDGGMHFNLHNNIWGTNFPMWCEDDLKFRFVLTIKGTKTM